MILTFERYRPHTDKSGLFCLKTTIISVTIQKEMSFVYTNVIKVPPSLRTHVFLCRESYLPTVSTLPPYVQTVKVIEFQTDYYRVTKINITDSGKC